MPVKMKKVISETDYPYNCCGLLKVKFEDCIFAASGFLVSSNAVLNLFPDVKSRTMAKSIKFYPGLNGKLNNGIKVREPYLYPK